jgi:hypothetical protein
MEERGQHAAKGSGDNRVEVAGGKLDVMLVGVLSASPIPPCESLPLGPPYIV